MAKLSKVNSIYGAVMGRPQCMPPAVNLSKFTLQRVRIDSGGYDQGGAYWGLGAPLYHAYAETGGNDVDMFFRAHSREEAKAIVRKTYPSAKFLR